MGKIKEWDKKKDSLNSVTWRNMYWSKTPNKWATIEEVSISKSILGWAVVYFINDGSRSSFQKNFKSRVTAYDNAILIMKNNKNSVRNQYFNERENKVKNIIVKIQTHAFTPIKNPSFASELMNQRMSDKLLDHDIWSNLSSDTSSGKLFKQNDIDPTMTVVFVDINYLRSKKGNKIFQDANDGGIGKSVNKIIAIIKSGEKLKTMPEFSFRRGDVDEGNHRVEALYQLGYKSAPVYIKNGWD